jgi:hypothetical protein
MRQPIDLKHALALTKRVTAHEKYANDMEYVASILGLTAYPLRHVWVQQAQPPIYLWLVYSV